MQTMNQSLATLYQKKLITLETAMTASSNRDELQDMINRGVGVVAGAGLGRPGAAAAGGAVAGRIGQQSRVRRRMLARTMMQERNGDFCIHRTDTQPVRTVTGERIADTMDAAVAALRREQILVTQINPVKEGGGQGRPRSSRHGRSPPRTWPSSRASSRS